MIKMEIVILRCENLLLLQRFLVGENEYAV